MASQSPRSRFRSSLTKAQAELAKMVELAPQTKHPDSVGTLVQQAADLLVKVQAETSLTGAFERHAKAPKTTERPLAIGDRVRVREGIPEYATMPPEHLRAWTLADIRGGVGVCHMPGYDTPAYVTLAHLVLDVDDAQVVA